MENRENDQNSLDVQHCTELRFQLFHFSRYQVNAVVDAFKKLSSKQERRDALEVFHKVGSCLDALRPVPNTGRFSRQTETKASVFTSSGRHGAGRREAEEEMEDSLLQSFTEDAPRETHNDDGEVADKIESLTDDLLREIRKNGATDKVKAL